MSLYKRRTSHGALAFIAMSVLRLMLPAAYIANLPMGYHTIVAQ